MISALEYEENSPSEKCAMMRTLLSERERETLVTVDMSQFDLKGKTGNKC